jgi:PA14 domain
VVASRLTTNRTPDGGRPFRATWRGQLVAPSTGRYQIELFTDGEVTLRLDGRAILTSEATPERPGARTTGLDLEAGPHALQLEYRYERCPGTIELIWQPPGGQRSIVPPSALRP